MVTISNAFRNATHYLGSMGISDYIDILLVAYIIYRVIMFIRKTNSRNIAIGVLLFFLILWVSDIAKLTMINALMQKAMELGLIALLILFQPELRRMLERMGSKLTEGRFSTDTAIESAISETVRACVDMSRTHTGALIVFERGVTLDEQMRSGTTVNSDVTAELLKNIFYPKAPLHDGAVVIRDGRIAAAGCVLPLTSNTNLSPDLGTRHRAGIGMSEHSDAVVVIVSEETGGISIAVDGMLKRRLSAETFEAILRSELLPAEEQQRRRWDVFVDFVKKLNPLRRENRYDKKDDNQQDHRQ